jgi:branched-subunit amino acid ABC-type transport system permease component
LDRVIKGGFHAQDSLFRQTSAQPSDDQRHTVIDLLVGTLSQTAVLTPLIISLSLIFRVSGVINFGAGFFTILAGTAAASWGGFGGTLVTLPIGAALGALAWCVAILPARSRSVPAVGLTVSTLGFGLIVGWFTRKVWGTNPASIQPWIDGAVTIGGSRASYQRLLVIGMAAVVLALLFLLFDRTVMGRTLEAVASDEELASMYGVHGPRFQLLAWAVAGMCMSVAGIFQAAVASISVDVAPTLLVLSLIGAVVGGLGSLAGSVGGAFVVAFAMTAASRYITGVYTLSAAFVVLFVVLAAKPRGLFTSGPAPVRV